MTQFIFNAWVVHEYDFMEDKDGDQKLKYLPAMVYVAICMNIFGVSIL